MISLHSLSKTPSLSTILIQPQLSASYQVSQEASSQSSQHHPLKKPLLIAFHGSGDSLISWISFSRAVKTTFPELPFLLYSRAGHGGSTGPANQSPTIAVNDLRLLLYRLSLRPPYILVAHSYGGCIARTFLQHKPSDIAGLILVETGQERALPAEIEKAQIRECVLDEKPVAVIRGNSLMGKWKELEVMERAHEEDNEAGTESSKQGVKESTEDKFGRTREMLERWDREDEKLKKAQLGLSKRNKYIYVPDVGHHVVRDRPDVVLEEVKWVLENLVPESAQERGGVWERLRSKIQDITK